MNVELARHRFLHWWAVVLVGPTDEDWLWLDALSLDLDVAMAAERRPYAGPTRTQRGES